MGKSLEEMCRLVTGAGAWHIGNIHVSDGPHGIRAQEAGLRIMTVTKQPVFLLPAVQPVPGTEN